MRLLRPTPDPDAIKRAKAIVRPWVQAGLVLVLAWLAVLVLGLMTSTPGGTAHKVMAVVIGIGLVFLCGLMAYVFNGPMRRADAIRRAAKDAAYVAFNEQVKTEFGVYIPDGDLWVLLRGGHSLVFEAEKVDGSMGVFNAIVTGNDLTVYEQQVKRASA